MMSDVNLSALAPMSRVSEWKNVWSQMSDQPKQELMYRLTLRSDIEAKQECSGLESGREIGHQLY
jgi:hypothetical protein